jgi:hypothetical protein
MRFFLFLVTLGIGAFLAIWWLARSLGVKTGALLTAARAARESREASATWQQ